MFVQMFEGENSYSFNEINDFSYVKLTIIIKKGNHKIICNHVYAKTIKMFVKNYINGYPLSNRYQTLIKYKKIPIIVILYIFWYLILKSI